MIKLNRIVVITFIALSAFSGTNNTALILESERYFPDDIGLQWTYNGSVSKQIQRISDYTNTAVVKGKIKKGGVPVVVFWESNQSNHGQAESYLLKDKDGITYFGGKPTTDLESQLVPYRVIQFPIVLGKTVLQVEKRNLAFDLDIDQDGAKERADTRAEVAATAIETVSTPAGIFHDTIKFQGTMTVWVTLSRDKRRVPILDTTTHWFAKDVGMVKQIEKLEFPEGFDGESSGTITTEVLTEYSKGGIGPRP